MRQICVICSGFLTTFIPSVSVIMQEPTKAREPLHRRPHTQQPLFTSLAMVQNAKKAKQAPTVKKESKVYRSQHVHSLSKFYAFLKSYTKYEWNVLLF